MVVKEIDLSKIRVLVTGSSGFLAIHCVQQLLEAGYSVRGSVRSLSNAKKVQPLYDLPFAKERLELVEADLENDETWISAVKECDYVFHTASPFPLIADDSIIPIAVNGSLAVLKACAKEASVKKVVLTSSVAAISEGHETENHIFTEKDWTIADPKKVEAYPRSKTAAEHAAWDFMNNLSETDNKFALTCINPSLIIGPVLLNTEGSSIAIIKRFMNNEMPALPALNIALVDVRDVAKAHILAMTNSRSDGERIIAASQPSLWFRDIAKILSKEFKSQGYSIPRFQALKFFLCLYSHFDPEAKLILNKLDKEMKFDNSKANNLLNLQFRNPETSLIEMAYSMIERGMIPKKSGYTKKVHF
uniref:3-beta hydroxysteroid dehydrogenase/isomerase domain-containing protein n=1 Tax=Panagrolaimus davidi TaxID=227884 RepID=A0A914Q0U9_9BILA